MSTDVIATRRAEAARALRDAGWTDDAGDIEADPLRLFDVTMSIDIVGATVDELNAVTPENRAALHALAVLLAALTEPT